MRLLKATGTHPDVATLTRLSEGPGGESRSVRPGDGGLAPVTLVPTWHGGRGAESGAGLRVRFLSFAVRGEVWGRGSRWIPVPWSQKFSPGKCY